MKRLFSSALLVAALLPLSALAGVYQFTASQTGFISTSTGLTHGDAGTWGLSGTSGLSNYSTGLWSDINGGGKVVTSATLTLTGIYDWTGETNSGNGQYDPADALFINILGGVSNGVSAQALFDPSAVGRNADTAWPTQGSPFFDNSSTSGDWNDTLQAAGLGFTDASANSLLKVTTQGTGGNDTKTGTPTGVTWSDPTGGVPSTLVITFNAGNLALLTSLLDLDNSGSSAPTVGLGFAAECHYYMTGVQLDITTGPASVPDTGSTLMLMGLGVMALVGFRRFSK